MHEELRTEVFSDLVQVSCLSLVFSSQKGEAAET